jgi:hypothetical protein
MFIDFSLGEFEHDPNDYTNKRSCVYSKAILIWPKRNANAV